ncbi:MAG: hypothetical protein LH618_19705, partial [Saprospiraceae bacterium]|nr:hypothetical protein [Saprospiraceae bacterium]
ISEIRKGCYIVHEKNLPIVEGQENNLDIKMVPRDGFLRLNIKNDMGQHDTIYAYIYSLIGDIEGSGSEGSLKTYPVILQTGDTYMEILQLASPETVAVRWGFNKLNYYQVDFAFQDSILVVPNDTTTYILSY